MLGCRMIAMFFDGKVWETAPLEDISRVGAEVMGGKRVGATVIIQVNAPTVDEEREILSDLAAKLGAEFLQQPKQETDDEPVR